MRRPAVARSSAPLRTIRSHANQSPRDSRLRPSASPAGHSFAACCGRTGRVLPFGPFGPSSHAALESEGFSFPLTSVRFPIPCRRRSRSSLAPSVSGNGQFASHSCGRMCSISRFEKSKVTIGSPLSALALVEFLDRLKYHQHPYAPQISVEGARFPGGAERCVVGPAIGAVAVPDQGCSDRRRSRRGRRQTQSTARQQGFHDVVVATGLVAADGSANQVALQHLRRCGLVGVVRSRSPHKGEKEPDGRRRCPSSPDAGRMCRAGCGRRAGRSRGSNRRRDGCPPSAPGYRPAFQAPTRGQGSARRGASVAPNRPCAASASSAGMCRCAGARRDRWPIFARQYCGSASKPRHHV